MMQCKLEHANIRVGSIANTIKFLMTAFPHFKVRGGSKPDEEPRWVHIGTEDTYISLYEVAAPAGAYPTQGVGLNHAGFVVDAVASIKQRLRDAGYQEGFVPAAHSYRTRIYFVDPDGLQWEFIEYLSDDPAKRNDYLL